MRKVVFAILVFVLAFAVPVTVYTIVSKSSDFDSRDQAADSDSDSDSNIPQVISVPPTSIIVGERYSYRVLAVDGNDDVLEYHAEKYPSWMLWNEELQTLEGVPGQADIGIHKVELVVGDGKSLGIQTFEVVVAREVEEGLQEDSDSDESGSGDEGGLEDESSGTGSFPVSDRTGGGGGTVSQETDTSDYGLVPIETVAEGPSSGGTVLGKTTPMPKTALFNGVIGLGIGVAVVSLALFLWVDARWNISDRFVSMFNYERGRQIGMDMGNGVKVKKRKIRL